MIKTVCKKCGCERNFNEDKFGKKFKCPNCGNIVQIEESTINVASIKTSVQSNDLSKEQLPPPKLPSTSNFLWKQVIVASFVALGLITVSIFIHINFKEKSLTDIDGNFYKTVQIGTQIWMAENLKTTKYRNGDLIPNVKGNSAWQTLTIGAYSWYNNDAASGKATYGALYNWYAVSDSRNIAPAGWHVASNAEWTTLITYLEGENIAGGQLKETGFIHWSSPNTGSTNSSGFAALPGGMRFYDGTFGNFGHSSFWWSSTAYVAGGAWYLNLTYDNANVNRYGNNNESGFSVRCVRD